jgi:thioredoxin
MIFFYETKTITFVPQKMIMTENLTKQTFLEKVFNYEKNKDWMYEGKLPSIIDFYADWCGPCKMIAPVLEELSNEYAGKMNIYKVDTEAEQELAAAFAIRSIPSMLFIPMSEQPQMANGALPKQELHKLIKEVLKVEI